MDGKYREGNFTSEDILNLVKKTVCSCKKSNTAEAIYFAHSKSKREFKSDEKEIRLKKYLIQNLEESNNGPLLGR